MTIRNAGSFNEMITTSNVRTDSTNKTIKCKIVLQETISNRDHLEDLTIARIIEVDLKIITITTKEVEATTKISTDSKTGSTVDPDTGKNKLMTSQNKNDNLL